MRDLHAPARAPVLRVCELVRLLRTCVEDRVPDVWVAGELSGFKVHASGHCYFRIKDADGQIAAVMFRSAARQVRFRPADGMAVLAHGRVSLYEARGDLQLYVDALELRGVGADQLALAHLRQRLAAEGLFGAERKRPLPAWPRAVGIATALSGAAVHDILTTLRARLPAVRAIVRPVRVQGAGAAAEIATALAELARVPEIDVIIVGRGGGSAQDLWTFNDERVVRAIAASRVPVVSAVGHEIDITLADLVADARAATPTAAATLVVPDARQLRRQLAMRAGALHTAMRTLVRRRGERLQALARLIRDPRRRLMDRRQRVDELNERSCRAVGAVLRAAQGRLAACSERLQALSPLAVLERGYAIARRADGVVVRDATQLAVGDPLDIIFRRGRARVRVETRGD